MLHFIHRARPPKGPRDGIVACYATAGSVAIIPSSQSPSNYDDEAGRAKVTPKKSEVKEIPTSLSCTQTQSRQGEKDGVGKKKNNRLVRVTFWAEKQKAMRRKTNAW